jgi:LytS/YehU family sensor histidine kinase
MGSAVITSSAFGARPSLPPTSLESRKDFLRIEENYSNAKAKVDGRTGRSYLKLFRRLVAKHNTKNHAGEIKIYAAMGACGITIGEHMLGHDSRWNGFQHREKTTPLMALLHEIEQALDYDWAWTLDGEALN